jgi:hypothetical protein
MWGTASVTRIPDLRSAASAFGWEFGRHHRWGFIAVAAYLSTVITLKMIIYGPETRVSFETTETFAFVVLVPMSSIFMYFLAVFSFGLAGDLAARESMYPKRLFTLPVTTRALAAWPMFYGALAIALLWVAIRLLGVWPPEVEVPLLWPALLAASSLAWTQALVWMPYPIRGVRVLVTVFCLILLEATVMIAVELKASEATMIALLTPHIPVAYLVAVFAVARGRRGDTPQWSIGGSSRTTSQLTFKPFTTAHRAQLWFEWRQHGRSLPLLVALVVPFELALLFVFPETPSIIFSTMLLALLTPPFMAAFVAATTVSRTNPNQSDSYGLTPFLATRPLSSGALISAKLKVTLLSTLASWLIVIVLISAALWGSRTNHIANDWLAHAREIAGEVRPLILGALILFVLLITTWKQLIQNLFVGLSGREWIIKGSVFTALVLLAIFFPLLLWLHDNARAAAAFWHVFPWFAAALACIKTVAALKVAIRLRARALVTERSLLLGAVWWNLVVLTLYALMAWLIPTLIIRHYMLALLAILIVPLTRLSAAPLALDWNRHR